ncbi:MAG TPA: nucleotidyltransferase domain-containing protein [Acidimicrobiales bacterium]|nr:nucleotidyltransferase domain-containing protein [Acidimicrobiales bacterium]
MNDEATNERSAPTLTMVRSHRDAILRAAHSRGVSSIRIFGSVARGDATPASDVDLLVDFERGRRGLDLFAFAREVEDLLGYPVEVGTGLDEVVRSRVEPQLVSL